MTKYKEEKINYCSYYYIFLINLKKIEAKFYWKNPYCSYLWLFSPIIFIYLYVEVNQCLYSTLSVANV